MNHAALTSLICGIAAAATCMSLGSVQAASLVPHRAFYTLEAARLDDSAGIAQISGKLAYEIRGSDCEGYSVNYRVANRYVQGEGQAQVSDVQLTSFESGDGLELDLQQKQFTNAKLDAESRIKVKRTKAGEAASGEIIGTEPKAFTIDAGAVFPTDFQKKLVEAAERGETRFNTLIYEGSEGEKSLRVISFIGAKKPVSALADSTPDRALAGLSAAAFWPVTISYYPVDDAGADEPTYQATFNMLDNGISTDLVMDYGRYALKGTLSKLEILKQDSCN
jgi:hypothetical protein